MGSSFRLTTDRYPAASLGCGTLVIIALIVWAITSAGYSKMADDLRSLRKEVGDLKQSVDAQSEQIRGLKEQIQGLNSAPKPTEVPAKF
jgi:hypothetical protein